MSPAVKDRVGNLPHELTSFVGRRHELAEAKRLLGVSRLVTLTGIGGVGKTRLALRLAQDSRRAFPDGVWLVEFGHLSTRELIEDSVVSALGLRDVVPGGPTSLAAHLTDKCLLLILDNCEHLVEEIATFTGSLLRNCRGLRVVATSREPLGVGGEAVLRVPPLGVPDPDRPEGDRDAPKYEAVALFEERACAAAPGFGVTDANRIAVTRICQQLDGLPLPIELAAARMRAMSAEQILQRLTDRYRLLGGANRGVPSRLQTLRTCIDWSYELCTPQERDVWGRLSVFSGWFELDAAEIICGDDLDPVDLFDVVASLVDKSILNRDEEDGVVGYRMLATLRDYGREKLAETGTDSRLRRTHRDWYEALVLRAEAQWIGPEQLRWRARLTRERPNIRAAMRFCHAEPGGIESGLRIASAMGTYYLSCGLLTEGRNWLALFLTSHDGTPTDGMVRALCADIFLAINQSDLAAGWARSEQARAAVAQLDDPILGGVVDHVEGFLCVYAEDLTRAVHTFDRALAVLSVDVDPLRRVSSLLGISLAHASRGDLTEAIASQEEALAITGERGENLYRAYALSILGLALLQSDPDRARAVEEQALQLYHTSGEILGIAVSVESLAWIAQRDGEVERAATLLGAAHTLWEQVGSVQVMWPALRELHAECAERVRRELGDRAHSVAFDRGARSSTDEIVAIALRVTPEPATSKEHVLTRRERQVADLVAQGLTNRSIAETLVISPRTAEGHVDRVLTKLGFNTRSQIGAWVAEQKRTELS